MSQVSPGPAQEAVANSYDLVPYDGWSYAQTHPDVLATVAALRGMSPAPVTECRVLEIGCAAGYNLIPMAVSLPGATFVGIDYSARQIAEGQSLIEELDVGNVQLHCMDIRDWDGALGQFDYIVAHGVYSWVPETVRSALLECCRQALAPQGIAYVSYNTYPGWHMLEALRRMMLYHVDGEDEPRLRAQKAHELIEFLAEATDQESIPYSSMLPAYQHLILNYLHGILKVDERGHQHLLHDELEETNHPVYFHEFVQHAAAHGLRYIADAEFDSGLSTNIPASVAAKLREMVRTDVEAEQYMDFIRNRTFRRSLLGHRSLQLSASVDMQALARFYFSAHAQAEPVETPDPSNTIVKFTAQDGASLATDHPVSVVALNHLNAIWPRRLQLDDLLDLAYRELAAMNPGTQALWQGAGDGANPAQRAEDRAVLGSNLVRAFCSSAALVNFHTDPGCFVTEISDRPLASRWARWQVQHRHKVSNLSLRRVELKPMGRFLLARLDGTRTIDDLVREILVGPVAAGEWQVHDEANPDGTTTPEVVRQSVLGTLAWFASAALLTA